jgi:hypothetical protein
MNNSIKLSVFEEKMKLATNRSIPEPTQAQLARIEKSIFNNPPPVQTRPIWHHRLVRRVIVALLILVVIGTLVVGPQKVLAALENLLTFIPGVGLVEPSETAMVLSESLRYEQDGVIYTVEAFYADENETILAYRVENLPAHANQEYIRIIRDENPNLVSPEESYRNGTRAVHLILPNGQHIQAQHTNVLNASSMYLDNTVWAEQLRYQALPEGTNQLRILFVQIPGMAKGIAPENVQLEVNLRPTEEGDIFPIFKPEIVVIEEPEEEAETPKGPLDLLDLNIDAVSMIEGDLLLQVNVSLEEYPDYWVSLKTNSVHLEDAQGKRLPLDYAQNENDHMMNPGQHIFKVLNFDLENTPQPLRLVADTIELYIPNQYAFTLEKPEDITYGECKQEPIEFLIIDGSSIHLDEMCLEQNPNTDNFPEYSVGFLQYTPLPDSLGIYFLLMDNVCEGIKPIFDDYCGGGSGGGGGEGENFKAEHKMSYWTEPQFPIEVTVGYSILLSRPWDTRFKLPEEVNSNPIQPDDSQPVEATAIPYEPGDSVSEYEDELEQLRTMLTGYGNQLLETGWVHMVVDQINSANPEFTLHYETWFNFDVQKNLIARYDQGYDRNGTLLSQTYYAHGIAASVSESEYEQSMAYRVNFYHDSVPLAFFSLVKQFEQKIYQEGYSLMVDAGQYNEQDVVIFELTSPPLVPYRCENNRECRVINTAYLDAATGRLIAENTYQTFPAGDPTISYPVNWEVAILEAFSDPPMELLQGMKTRAEEIISRGIMEPREDSHGGGGGS